MSATAAVHVLPRSRWAPRHWALWRAPARLVVLLLSVEASAALWVTLTFSVHVRAVELARAASVLVVGVVFEETSRRVANLRLRVANLSYFDMSSVWTFGAALILPVTLVAAVVFLLRLHMWCRYQRVTRHQVYRHIYTFTVIVLSCLTAQASVHAIARVLHPVPAAGVMAVAVVVAIVVYRLINTGLIAAAVALSEPGTSVRALIGTPDANVLELTTVCLGAATAFVAMRDALLVVLLLAPVIMLQRAAMVKELAHAATIDAKTGLLNLSSWTHVGTTELNRASRANEQAALMIVDLDHFKQVNDAVGHLAGDEVLHAVAQAIGDQLRDYDIIGRFGGEEFVALLPSTDSPAARDAAERLRLHIKQLNLAVLANSSASALSISVGVACFPRDGRDVAELLDAADGALYRAKEHGRDRVEFAVIPTPDFDDMALRPSG